MNSAVVLFVAVVMCAVLVQAADETPVTAAVSVGSPPSMVVPGKTPGSYQPVDSNYAVPSVQYSSQSGAYSQQGGQYQSGAEILPPPSSDVKDINTYSAGHSQVCTYLNNMLN